MAKREGPITIVHKKTKGVGECMPEALDVWLDNGWAVSDAENKPAAKSAAVSAAAEEK